MFVSFNKGDTWEAYNAGLPLAAMIFDLVVSPTDSNLIAFTHGNGVYKAPLKMQEAIVLSSGPIQEVIMGCIYPNPATNYFYVELNNESIENIKVEILNSNGDIMLNNYYKNDGEIRVNCPGLITGNYLVKLSYGNNYGIYKLVVV